MTKLNNFLLIFTVKIDYVTAVSIFKKVKCIFLFPILLIS